MALESRKIHAGEFRNQFVSVRPAHYKTCIESNSEVDFVGFVWWCVFFARSLCLLSLFCPTFPPPLLILAIRFAAAELRVSPPPRVGRRWSIRSLWSNSPPLCWFLFHLATTTTTHTHIQRGRRRQSTTSNKHSTHSPRVGPFWWPGRSHEKVRCLLPPLLSPLCPHRLARHLLHSNRVPFVFAHIGERICIQFALKIELSHRRQLEIRQYHSLMPMDSKMSLISSSLWSSTF